ncbi:TPA: CvpA family protein [Candidatus Ventrenecus stercoripullorum]|nr:CvpA family protein [Candidatus Ventrenecus stercoripullorum]
MGTTIDIIIVLILLIGAVVGFKRGVIKSAVTFIGAIVVIILAFYLKNPVSKLMYTYLPFFNFAGDFEGLTVLNIVIYEALAFVIVYVILMSILQILISVTGVIEKVLNFTIVLGIPSKLLGALFGFFETYLFVFVALFLLSQIPVTNAYIKDSFVADKIANSSPILSGISENYYKAFEEIISIKDQNIHDKNEYNRQSLDILLKYDIVDVDSARDLIESGKMPIENAEGILDKYE